MALSEHNVASFKNDVKSFVSIDQKIAEIKNAMKPFQTELKELKSQRKMLESEICDLMSRSNLEEIDLSDGRGGVLELQTKTALVPLTQKTIREKFVDFFTDGPGNELSFNSKNQEEKAQILFDYIYKKENRDRIEKDILKESKR
jgi:hypothetical protein